MPALVASGVRVFNGLMPTGDGSRALVAREAARALALRRAEVAGLHALVGLDGFVDTIIRAVRRRTAPGAAGFEPMTTIDVFADRVRSGAGRSANIELFVERVKLGGNGVLLAGALLALGAQASYAGNLGESEGGKAPLHPVFRPFAARCRTVLNLGPTGYTDAIEFDDGKIMLGKLVGLEAVTWQALTREAGGLAGLTRLVGGVRLLAMGNWRALPGMTRVWQGLARDVLPSIDAAARPAVFVDLADPSERSDADLIEGLRALGAINGLTPVTLGLNAAESARIADLLGARHHLGRTGEPEAGALREAASNLGVALELACVVCHSRRAAAGAEALASSSFEGPFVRKPKLSTGAGDHFNAGFALARALGLPLEQCLAAGCACSGWYVREGEPPSLDQLVASLDALPDPEP